MFTERSLPATLREVRAAHAPDALVLDCGEDFETIPPAQAEELALVTDSLSPHSCPEEWLPPDAPAVLERYAGPDLTIGLPGDGSVAWTHQTEPPVVFCKPRLDGTPEGFAEFLIAEALVQVGLDAPEQFLDFFGPEYPRFAAATDPLLGPVETYQVGAACYEAFLGLQTREVFAGWDGDLFDAWVDAGERLEGRLEELPEAMSRGETSFSDGAELACSAIKHAGDVPAPFDALDAAVYLDHGPEFAVEWARRTIDALV